MRFVIFFYIFFGIINSVSAQTWEIGGFVGGSGYIGDINPVKPYKLSGGAFGGQIKRNLDGYWALKLNVMHGKIGADDADASNAFQKQRNINFFTPITELSFQTEFNFFNYFPGSLAGNGTRKATPYLFTGIGGVLFNPKAKYAGDEYVLRDHVTEGADKYKRYSLSVPYGAGVKYNLTGNWNIIGEVGYRTVFSDYLDDLSGKYPNFLTLSSEDYDLSDPSIGKIGVTGTQRGDLRKRDTYMFTGLSLTYTFVSSKCFF